MDEREKSESDAKADNQSGHGRRIGDLISSLAKPIPATDQRACWSDGQSIESRSGCRGIIKVGAGRGRALVGSLAVMSAAVVLISAPSAMAVSGPQNFPNSRIADVALRYVGQSRETGFDKPGECVKWVQAWVAEAGGSMPGGGPLSLYRNAGAAEIGLDQAQRGDVFQISQGDTWNGSPHTGVFTSARQGDGAFDIVAGNVPAGSGTVATSHYRPSPPAGHELHVWRFGQEAGNRDLYFIKTKNTGSGRVEAFTATQGSSYTSGISTAVARFSPSDANNGWFGMLPSGDVSFIKTKNTGSGKVEVFTATPGSGYSSGINSTSRFSPLDANNGWFGMLASGDMYFIKTKNTSSGKVEAFTGTQASSYTSGVASTTRFSPADADNGWFRLY